MSAFAGSSLIVTWLAGTGTTVLTGDHRNFSFTPSIDYIDETAGADVHKQRLAGVKDSNATYESVLQGSSGSGGTAMTSVLTEGTFGTLVWSPEGTAGGKTKFTWPCYSGGASFAVPYDNVIAVTVNFQGNGVATAGTN
jgi:hypothetical protein